MFALFYQVQLSFKKNIKIMTIKKNIEEKAYYTSRLVNDEVKFERKTSFVLNIIYTIIENDKHKYIVEIVTTKFVKTAVISPKVMSNFALFKEFLYSYGVTYCSLTTTELALIFELELENDAIQKIKSVPKIGYYDDKYILSNGVYDRNGFHKYNSNKIAIGIYHDPIVKDPTVTAVIEDKSLNCSVNNVQIIAKAIRQLNNNYLDGVFGMAYIQTCMYATKIHEKLGFFPMLFISGEKSTGKNFLTKTLSRLIGMDRDGDGLPNTSKVGLMRRLSQMNDFPYWVDEYSSDSKSSMIADAVLRSAFNRSIGAKATIDPEVMVNLEPTASVIVTGESMPVDPATRDRFVTIELTTNKKIDKKSIPPILHNQDEMAKVGAFWFSESLNTDFEKMWEEMISRRQSSNNLADSRLLDCYMVVNFFFKKICALINVDSEDHKEFILKQLTVEIGDREKADALYVVWESIMLTINNGNITNGKDYRITLTEFQLYFNSFWAEKERTQRFGDEGRISKDYIIKYFMNRYPSTKFKTIRLGKVVKRCLIFNREELPEEINQFLQSKLESDMLIPIMND